MKLDWYHIREVSVYIICVKKDTLGSFYIKKELSVPLGMNFRCFQLIT